jgi:hypothetical protein
MTSKFIKMANKAIKKVTKTMGENIIYHYNNGSSMPMCAVFYINNQEVDLGGSMNINSVKYEFLIAKCAIDRRPVHGDTITSRNATFEVIDVIEDGISSYIAVCHSVDARYAGAGDILYQNVLSGDVL